ncbi:MAG: hypothetical protein Q8R92_14855 [Deltaproteobacteria bacterium]|nr:hypothetical protein [Deltaproteobacteria bacterium]
MPLKPRIETRLATAQELKEGFWPICQALDPIFELGKKKKEEGEKMLAEGSNRIWTVALDRLPEGQHQSVGIRAIHRRLRTGFRRAQWLVQNSQVVEVDEQRTAEELAFDLGVQTREAVTPATVVPGWGRIWRAEDWFLARGLKTGIPAWEAGYGRAGEDEPWPTGTHYICVPEYMTLSCYGWHDSADPVELVIEGTQVYEQIRSLVDLAGEAIERAALAVLGTPPNEEEI